MDRTLAILKGATPAQALAKYPGSATDRAVARAAGGIGPSVQPVGGSSAGTTYYTPGKKSPARTACSSTTCLATRPSR